MAMVTLQDIAKAANVSTNTVSRALQPGTHYKRPTFARRARQIQTLATQMGYRPNASARATREGRCNAFALLQSTEQAHSVLPDAMLSGIHQAMEPRGLHLVVSRLPDAKLTAEGYVPKILRETAADGLLVNYSANIPGQMIALINRHHIPSIWINSQQPADCVYPDDLAASKQATRRLLELGHRRVTYIDYTQSLLRAAAHYSNIERRGGYDHVMLNAGLTPRYMGSVEALGELLRVHRELVAVLSTPDRPTAVVCYGPREARSVAAAALTLGLILPRDLSIVMFADNGAYDEMGLHFATMVLPEVEIGRAAVAMLEQRIDQPDAPQPAVALPFDFKPEQTLAPPPSA